MLLVNCSDKEVVVIGGIGFGKQELAIVQALNIKTGNKTS